jgi:cyanophycin synthetase
MSRQSENLCFHCDPYPNDSRHTAEKLEQTLVSITGFFSPYERLLKKSPRLYFMVNKLILNTLFQPLLLLRILTEVEALDTDDGLYNRSLVVIREARNRGIEIKSLRLLGKPTNHFSIVTNKKKEFFEGLPDMGHAAHIDFDDKGVLKRLLQQAGLPHPRGKTFRSCLPALQYIQDEIGFPVVVKPRAGSLSKHTTCNIKTAEQLQEAVEIAKIISKEFIVEEFIQGDVHRITIVNGVIVASCLREKPNVIGDGKHTVRELVEIKNQSPKRGDRYQKNTTLHKISISPRSNLVLLDQGLNLESVPVDGKKIYLHDKVILACGADIHDTTDQIHPENAILFKKVYQLCEAPLIGIDVITKDISKPHIDERCAVLEVNSQPYIDMHHYPVTGQPRNVAGHILDYYQ